MYANLSVNISYRSVVSTLWNDSWESNDSQLYCF